ncbi:hypothetical protein ABEW50_28755, partial [Paenibacillus jamilae]
YQRPVNVNRLPAGTGIKLTKKEMDTFFKSTMNKGLKSKGTGQGSFKQGKLFESKIVTKNGIEVGGLAETVVKGKTLTLKDVTIYSNKGDIKNAVGPRDILQWQKEISRMAKNQGFETLNIQGMRVSGSTSANPGKIVDYTIDLTKLK